MQEDRIQYVEPDENENEMDDTEDFEGIPNGECGNKKLHLSTDLKFNLEAGSCPLQRFFSYVLFLVVSMKKLHGTRMLDSKNCVGLLKYVARCGLYLEQEGKYATLI